MFDDDPENRLVASELEARGNQTLTRVGEVENMIVSHKAAILSRGTSVVAAGFGKKFLTFFDV